MTDAPRVLLVDPSHRGGIATYTRHVAEALAEAGAYPIVLTARTLELPPADGPITSVLRLPHLEWGRPDGVGNLTFYRSRMTYWLRAAATVLSTVRAQRPEVVHFQAPLNPRLDPYLIRLLRRRCTVVATAHDALDLEHDADQHLRPLRAVDRVIVHTDVAARVLEHAGIDAARIEVVEHVPTRPVVEMDRSAARAELGLPEEGRVLAALGFVRPYKNYGLLVEVWRRLGADAPLLLVIGDAWSETDARTLEHLAELPRTDVRVGFAPDRTLHLAAVAADALLLPHRIASDSGLLHLARAYGTPVIASDAPQLAASVRGSGAGIVVSQTVEDWAAAVTGPLPARPPVPPTPAEVGRRHLVVYQAAADRVTRARPRLLAYTDAVMSGGAERVLTDLVAGLAETYQVTVLGVDEEVVARIAREAGGLRTLVASPVRGKTDVAAIREHLAIMRRERPDVLLVNLRVPWAAQYGVLAGQLARVPVVAVEHLAVPTVSRLQRLLRKGLSARLAAHVAVSGPTARAVEEFGGLRDGSVRVVLNGIALRSRADVVARERESPEEPLLVSCGRMVPEKGFDTLLRALTELPGARLWLAGDGPELPALKALAAELGITDRVDFLGWASDVAPVLAAADLVVLPSRREGFALTVIEAMALGCAVLASDIPGISDVLEGTGVVVPVADPLALAAAAADLLADPGRRRALGDAAATRAWADLSAARMVADYEGLLAAVLRRG